MVEFGVGSKFIVRVFITDDVVGRVIGIVVTLSVVGLLCAYLFSDLKKEGIFVEYHMPEDIEL